MTTRPQSWASAADAFAFALACQQVIALRLTRIALGDKGQHEVSRMVSEKIAAAAKAQVAAVVGMATGRPDQGAKNAANIYWRAVSANRRRLSK